MRKQFNLQEFLKNPTLKVVTYQGEEVRIICTDGNDGEYPVVGFIGVSKYISMWSKTGKYKGSMFAFHEKNIFFEDDELSVFEKENNVTLFVGCQKDVDDSERPIGWTTLEESRRLVELGLEVKTADMHWKQVADGLGEPWVWRAFCGNDVAIVHDLFSYRQDYVVPCWSLGRLIELLKTYAGQTWEVYGTLDNGAFFGFSGITTSVFIEKTFIEAVVRMTEWLLEKGVFGKEEDKCV